MNRIAKLAILFFFCLTSAWAGELPQNLWQGLISEDTSGNLQTYRIIASVVTNRLQNGLNNGLIALQRPNLASFVAKECQYAKAVKNADLKAIAQQAIKEVFDQNKDYAFGATHYEHTKVYPIPKWAKNMKVVKIIYEGTKQEITLWRAK